MTGVLTNETPGTTTRSYPLPSQWPKTEEAHHHDVFAKVESFGNSLIA
jgi:hypothetical protein